MRMHRAFSHLSSASPPASLSCFILSSPVLTSLIPCALVIYFSAPCCRPPRHTAMASSVPGMLHATRRVPNVTNTCGGCCISGRWTLNLLCGRCFTCSRHHRGSTATFTTENRPRTSGPGMILLFWFCSASGCVVSVLLLFIMLYWLCV